MFGLSELAVILIVVILVIGAKRLPDLARSAGKSARILKAEAKAMKREEAAEQAREEQAAEHASHGQPAAPTGTAPRVVEGTVVPPGTGPVHGTAAAQPATEADRFRGPDGHRDEVR
ncbi:Sec-independent protein translocase subunit TatA [Streptomyces sp. CRN 30]|uniref:Sec-independent protein translocase subunit TatA n=1 Tax=Streptomyces sp. CRN 30 TaxID=3075613 RepID=UPI002A81B52C|nr:Sec-independent protein translocase subunit TatA [Streptomyces sp. CRN 30]